MPLASKLCNIKNILQALLQVSVMNETVLVNVFLSQVIFLNTII